MLNSPIVRSLGVKDYLETWHAMRAFTDQRTPETIDEIWLLEHPPVYTLGQNGDPAHVLAAKTIPLIKTDRGGQVTYHGPGQLITYILFDIQRHKMNIRQLVSLLENTVIELLADYAITARADCKAPGVYIENKKIASIGLRIRRGCSYHGLALNVDMDLEPYSRINPCGFSGMQMTDLRSLKVTEPLEKVGQRFAQLLSQKFTYQL